MLKHAGVAVGMALLAATPAAAQNKPAVNSPLIQALDRCRAITDSAQRLTCFDGAAATLVDAAKSGSVAVVDRSEMRQARRALFGFSMPKLPFFSGDRSAEDDRDELETTITAVRSIGYGKYQFRIADGNALWETSETFGSMRDPRAGQKIVIKRGLLGSYMLRINGQRGVKGRRVG